jgi:hypothetical protein
MVRRCGADWISHLSMIRDKDPKSSSVPSRVVFSILAIVFRTELAALHGRLPPFAGRAPPKIPKCSRERLACSFGVRSSTLSQSRLNRSAACLPAWRELSRWSPSSGRAFFRYFGGDGGSTYPGGDGGSTAFSLTVEGLGSTTGGFRLRARSSSSMMLGSRNAARLPARQRKKYRSGWCQLMFSFRSIRAANGAANDRQH